MDDDLLADLDDLGDDDIESGDDAQVQSGRSWGALNKKRDVNGKLIGNDDQDMESMDEDEEPDEDGKETAAHAAADAAHTALMASLKDADDVRSVLKVIGSKHLRDVLQKIALFLKKERLPEHNTGPVEDDPEYSVLVQSNNLTVDLDSEVIVVHRFIRDHYAPRFPELESLVLNPVEFARAVQMIGNEEDLTTLDLKSFLPSATIMVVTVTATTTNGRRLTDEELSRVMIACNVALELDTAKRQILEYVESRMSFIAPNLTAILGSGVATKLMGHAGGLTALSKIPACNILVLGAQKKTNTGLSRVSMGKHAGFIYQCNLVLQLPDELRRKAARLLSAKCALAARIDCARESVDGMAGKGYREDIEKKIEVLLQPPPSQKTKALPIPDEGPKKRRGGRRVRKAKERNAQTDLRKAQNRMVFGEAEEEYGYGGEETVGLGMVGRQTGKIRGTQLDTRVKVSVAKKHRAFASHSAHTSGLSSSVAFTPIKGIELENPEVALQRVKEANNKYFSGGQFKKPLPR
ncbi:hypothetical protein BASA61_004293 [Batrachochytrium salamandrivorans]|nr:hypothetical protein BASA62_007928 [Batrachochytrium salamandrivorans]KAH6571656.1 hypothetical protein BASA60_007053 [Batrachochytrium salamandrivorans]KAH6593456.1 hypothetical protein BASA61_004293 [Batrachochytrium salamandrivorans]KAH9255920.1 hypothetical protein BASA81_005955 [Batrachochytrium salamandrivorans]KAH9272200.1 hypothetical protein BASA83_005541 [Batrachochytrium salamandrivorans]